MQDTGDELAIKRLTTSNILICIYIDSYQNFRITANQKSTIDTQTNKKSQLKYNIKDSHQTRRGKNKRRRKEKKRNKNKSKAINKMAIRTYISIITWNVMD